VADLTTYLRVNFGNQAAAVSPEAVRRQR
jgi:hypothetical protein